MRSIIFRTSFGCFKSIKTGAGKTGIFLSKIILSFLMSWLWLACDYSTVKSSQGGAPSASNGLSTLDFQSVKQQIFIPYCLSCHSSFQTYAGVKAQLAAIRDAVATSRMPKNQAPLSAADRDFLFNWIDAGAPEVSTGAGAGTPPVVGGDGGNNPQPPGGNNPSKPADSDLTYQFVKIQVLDMACLTCHSAAGGNKGRVNLETYFNVQQNAEEIYETVSRDEMPLRTKLTPLQKEILLRWIDLGMPQ